MTKQIEVPIIPTVVGGAMGYLIGKNFIWTAVGTAVGYALGKRHVAPYKTAKISLNPRESKYDIEGKGYPTRIDHYKGAPCSRCGKTIPQHARAVGYRHKLSFFYYHPECWKKRWDNVHQENPRGHAGRHLTPAQKKWLDEFPNAGSVDELPLKAWQKLEAMHDYETLWQDANRYLGDKYMAKAYGRNPNQPRTVMGWAKKLYRMKGSKFAVRVIGWKTPSTKGSLGMTLAKGSSFSDVPKSASHVTLVMVRKDGQPSRAITVERHRLEHEFYPD